MAKFWNAGGFESHVDVGFQQLLGCLFSQDESRKVAVQDGASCSSVVLSRLKGESGHHFCDGILEEFVGCHNSSRLGTVRHILSSTRRCLSSASSHVSDS